MRLDPPSDASAAPGPQGSADEAGASYRLGFAVKVLGAGGLPSADTRRWRSGPHLRRSVELLTEVFAYLEAIDVRVYRLSSQTIPYGTHPDLPHLHYRRQLDEAGDSIDGLRDEAIRLGLRLSTHPGQYTVLNAVDPAIVDKAIADLEQDALLLERLGQGPESAVVVHVGGAYGDPGPALDRWERAWDRLSERARSRLALENDERLFGLEDVLELHRRTGVRVVLDVHHLRIHPRDAGVSLRDAIAAAARTWPAGVRPKVHLSSARTMLEPPPPGARQGTVGYPPLSAHADLVLPWDLEAVVTAAATPMDVMLEAKAKDLALLQLRRSLAELRPAVARREERRQAATPGRPRTPGAVPLPRPPGGLAGRAGSRGGPAGIPPATRP